jgi:hypothetical protein
MTFGLVKHNNNSISAITTPGSLAQGGMTLLQTQTASSSASISFTSNIDSTYPIYLFKFINIHPSGAGSEFQVNFSTDGGSNYNVTKTTSVFYAYHKEDGSNTTLTYNSSEDLAQSTAFQDLTVASQIGTDNDESASGSMFLYSPSSTTFVKHFMSETNYVSDDGTPFSINCYIAGYANTTSAIDAVRFQLDTNNIQSGTIKLYGIKGS